VSRTTPLAVQGILGKQYDALTDLQQFIDTASAVVDDTVQCASQRKWLLSPAKQELIERYLAAHFYAAMDQLMSQKSTGQASATYQGQTAMSLDGTKYGQVAMNLDYSGCLSAISKRAFARGFWMGTPCGSANQWVLWP